MTRREVKLDGYGGPSRISTREMGDLFNCGEMNCAARLKPKGLDFSREMNDDCRAREGGDL
jgi:hypothetical protein